MNNNTSNYLVYAIYSRKSKFTGKGESIENQIELCKNQLINKYNIKEENIKIYQDEGFTGYNTNRPQFQEMIKDIRNKKIKCVIVYRLDRISRNVTDFCNLKNEFIKYNTDFISVTENFDTSTPMGRAMMYIASVFAQLEREIGAERIKDNMRELAKTGRWLGGTTPTGYESVGFELLNIKETNENNEIERKTKKAFMLKEINEEMIIIKIIFQKFLELKSLTALETFAINNNIKTKNKKEFTRFTLKTILTNPVYAISDLDMYGYFLENEIEVFSRKDEFDGIHGIMAYNKTLQIKHKANKRNDMNEWIIAVRKA